MFNFFSDNKYYFNEKAGVAVNKEVHALILHYQIKMSILKKEKAQTTFK